MTGKRWNGSAFTDLGTRKRWNGTAWVDLTVAKRWDGTQWVDLFGPPAGGTTPTYVASSYATTVGTAPVTLAVPAGTQNNDIVFLHTAAWGGCVPVPNAGTWNDVGWAPSTATPPADTAIYFYVRWCRAASLPANLTVTTGNPNGQGLIVAAHTFRGCVTSGQPYRTWRLGTDDVQGSSKPGAAVADAQPTDLVVQFASLLNVAAAIGVPAPWVNKAHNEYVSGTQKVNLAVATDTGNTSAPTYTASASGYWETGGIALIGA